MEQKNNRAGRAGERREYTFRNLALWKKGQELTLEVIRLADGLPSKPSATIIAKQLVRSASSISANVAEGHGRYSKAAYRNHLSIARGSAAETITWLDLLVRAGYIAPDLEKSLSSTCDDIIGGLTSQMRALPAKIAAEGGRSLGDKRAEYLAGDDHPDDDSDAEVL